MTTVVADNYVLLNLPEEIIRIIFRYLPQSNVHFNVRAVCRQLREFVDNYIKIDSFFEENALSSGFKFKFSYINSITNALCHRLHNTGCRATVSITSYKTKEVFVKSLKKSNFGQYGTDPSEAIALGHSQNSNVSYVAHFSNALSSPVDIFWINFNGDEVRYKKNLLPRSHYSVQTYFTHPWIFRKSMFGDERCPAYSNGKNGWVFEGIAFGAEPESNFFVTIKEDKFDIYKFRHSNIMYQCGYTFGQVPLNPETPVLDPSHHLVTNYAIYPFMENRSLDTHLNKFSGCNYGGLTAIQRLHIALGIAKGIGHIHYSNFLHCNISSGNILLDENMQPRVGGLNELMEVPHNPLADTEYAKEYFVGPLAYMPPEGLKVNHSKKSDVYSFGIVLLELLSGICATYRNWNLEIRHKSQDVLFPFDECWVSHMEEAGRRIHSVAWSRCLNKDQVTRATMPEIVTDIENIISTATALHS